MPNPFEIAASIMQEMSKNFPGMSPTNDKNLSFPEALSLMMSGKLLVRDNWRNVLYVTLHTPGSQDTPTEPFLLCQTIDDKYSVWNPSQQDMFAKDWHIVSTPIK